MEETRRLRILHLYPDHMNLYGDRGNVLTLVKRAEWRNIDASIQLREIGEPIDWEAVDLVFMGGGEDTHQAHIADDFLGIASPLVARLAEGLPMLAICGAYQLLGEYYVASDGTKLPGLGFLDVYTERGDKRAIGDVVTRTDLEIDPKTVVGFENHGGRTYLRNGTRPLGQVRLGRGNNGEDGTEGAIKGHVIGTYLHGSLLPKNPHLADMLLEWGLQHSGQNASLGTLNIALEMQAHQTILNRAQFHR